MAKSSKSPVSAIAQAWKSEITQRPSILWRYALLVTVFYVTIFIRAYQTFLTAPADWLDYGQRLHSLWMWINGAGSAPWGVIWLAPLFRLFPYGQTLLVGMALLLASGGVAATRLAGPSKFRFVIPLIYWLHFPILLSLSNGFHDETAIPPLALWAMAGLEGNRYWGWPFLLLALTLSPLGAAVGAGIAVVWILESKLIRGVLLLGLSPFLLLYRLPETWGMGFHPERILWLILSWGVLAGLPLLTWRRAIGVLPLMAFAVVVETGTEVVHWILAWSFFGFWCLPEALPVFWDRIKRHRQRALILSAIAMIAPLGIWALATRPDPAVVERSVWLSQDVFHTLSGQGSWRVPEPYLPALARRETITTDLSKSTQASCVILDVEVEPQTRSMRAVLLEEGFHEAWSCREFMVFERGLAGCLSKRPECR